MINLNLNRRIRQTLYVLKRAFGNMVTIYRFLESNTDYKTGVKTNVTETYVVRKCIILPVKITREVVQSVSAISANKSFVYGGSYDTDSRDFIIDARDVPAGYLLRQNDYIVYNDTRYEFKNVVELEQKTGWLISGKAVVGPATIRVSLVDNLDTNEYEGPVGPVADTLTLNQTVSRTNPVTNTLSFTQTANGQRVLNIVDELTLDESSEGQRVLNIVDELALDESSEGTV